MKKHKLKKFIVNKRKSKKLWKPTDTRLDEKDMDMKSWFDCLQFESKKERPKLVKYLGKGQKNKKPQKRKTFNKKQTDNREVIRCKKIKLLPNAQQRDILILWTDIYRYVYNQTLNYLRKHNGPYNFSKLRKIIKPLLLEKHDVDSWIKNSKIPEHTFDNAIHDVVKAHNSAIELLKQGHISHFKLRYKKATSARQTLVLEESCFHYNQHKKQKDDESYYLRSLFDSDTTSNMKNSKNTFCPTVMGDYIKTSEDISKIIVTCRMTFNRNTNEFFLFVPETRRKVFIHNRKDIASIDPGIRTFQTIYSSNAMIELGNNCFQVLKGKMVKLDKIDKKRREMKTSGLSCKKINKKYHAVQRKITNLVDELHFKTRNYLCKNYHTIVIGKISTQSIVKGNLITDMTKRVLLALRHFEFRMRLKAKCEESHIQFYEVDESYTTKTCSVCGVINHNVGANKLFKCVNPNCLVKMKRDYNGARGIFLKNSEEYKEICLF